MWVYIETKDKNFAVGFYEPGGTWHQLTETYDEEIEAMTRVNYLNGGMDEGLLMSALDYLEKISLALLTVHETMEKRL